MTNTTRTWRCYAPGYRIRNRVSIYGGGHKSVGHKVFELFSRFLASYPECGVWLEFGGQLSYEDRAGTSKGPVVSVEDAFCTGLR